MQWEFSSACFFFLFHRGWVGLILFCILIAQASCLNGIPVDLLHRFVVSWCFFVVFSCFTWKPQTRRAKSAWNTPDQNKHQLVKSPWNWMSIMQHKMQKYFKPFFGDHTARHNGSLLWLSRHVQRLMSCSQRTKFNEWDQCVLICCSVSGHCTLSRGRSLSNHILTRQLPWKRKRWRMWANERLESHGVEESCSMTVMIRIEFVLGGAVHSKDVCLAARTFETSLA